MCEHLRPVAPICCSVMLGYLEKRKQKSEQPGEARQAIKDNALLFDRFQGIATEQHVLRKPPPGALPHSIRVDAETVQQHDESAQPTERGLSLRGELLRDREVGVHCPCSQCPGEDRFPTLRGKLDCRGFWQVAAMDGVGGRGGDGHIDLVRALYSMGLSSNNKERSRTYRALCSPSEVETLTNVI